MDTSGCQCPAFQIRPFYEKTRTENGLDSGGQVNTDLSKMMFIFQFLCDFSILITIRPLDIWYDRFVMLLREITRENRENKGENHHEKTLAIALLAATGNALAGSNLVINGDFEDNTAGGTIFNISNADFTSTMANATAFSTDNEELDIMFGDGGYGLNAYSGDYKIGLANTGGTDALSLDLSSPLMAGTTYSLSFYANQVTLFGSGTESLNIGISNDPTSFGSLVYSTGDVSDIAWELHSTTFVATGSESYLTLQMDNNPGSSTWIHVDAFTLTVVPAPGSLAVFCSACMFGRRRSR